MVGGSPPGAAVGPRSGGLSVRSDRGDHRCGRPLPPDVHRGPLLVISPALIASVAGPRLTALVGALAVAAQMIIGVLHGGFGTSSHISQIVSLAVLSVLIVIFCRARERRGRQLNRVRSVSETAQLVLLKPSPPRVGPLRVEWLYLAAEDETKIGGDLLAFARTAHPSTRAVCGDVHGKGLASIGKASVVLAAFREGRSPAYRTDRLGGSRGGQRQPEPGRGRRYRTRRRGALRHRPRAGHPGRWWPARGDGELRPSTATAGARAPGHEAAVAPPCTAPGDGRAVRAGSAHGPLRHHSW